MRVWGGVAGGTHFLRRRPRQREAAVRTARATRQQRMPISAAHAATAALGPAPAPVANKAQAQAASRFANLATSAAASTPKNRLHYHKSPPGFQIALLAHAAPYSPSLN